MAVGDRWYPLVPVRPQRTDQITGARAEVAWLTQGQQGAARFVAAEGWRRDEVHRLREQLAEHWAGTVVTCVQAGDPLAHGTDPLRAAAHHRHDQLGALDAHVPPDHTAELDRTTRQLTDAIDQRRMAAERLTFTRARLEDAPRRERDVARADVDRRLAELRARTASERDLRVSVDRLTDHQRQRRALLSEQQPTRGPLQMESALLARALDDTLAERTIALAADPSRDLLAKLGPVPANEAGRAVWCHHAAAAKPTSTTAPVPRLNVLRSNPRQEIALAATAPDPPRSDTLEAWAAVTASVRPVAIEQNLRRHEQTHQADHHRAPVHDITPSM